MARTPRKSTALTTKSATSMTTMEQELAAEAAAIAAQIGKPTGNKIRMQGNQFQFPDGTIDPGPIDLVIVGFLSGNFFYEGPWDPENPVGPVCFALGKNISQLVPSRNSPKRQAEACNVCAMNEFGSNGKGKACKNTRLLAVLPADADADTPLMILEISPTAIKGFDAYVATVNRLYGKPPISVVTRVKIQPIKSYAIFTFGDPQPNTRLEAFFARRSEAEQLLLTEPDVGAPTPTANRRSRRAA